MIFQLLTGYFFLACRLGVYSGHTMQRRCLTDNDWSDGNLENFCRTSYAHFVLRPSESYVAMITYATSTFTSPLTEFESK